MFRFGTIVAETETALGTANDELSFAPLVNLRRNLEIDEIQKPKNQTQQLIVEYLYLPEGCDDIDGREDKHNLGECLSYVIYSIL